MKKNYTREEKINYFKDQLVKADARCQFLAKKIKALQESPDQDWDSDLSKELREKTLSKYGI